jgi:hypothetical protein
MDDDGEMMSAEANWRQELPIATAQIMEDAYSNDDGKDIKSHRILFLFSLVISHSLSFHHHQQNRLIQVFRSR